MKVTTNKTYNYSDSFDRLQEILDSAETFERLTLYPTVIPCLTRMDTILSVDIFIDIRDSSTLPTKYQKGRWRKSTERTFQK